MSGPEDIKSNIAPSERESTKKSQERKIAEFLAENLPPTEQRIQEPMNPNCEVCIVLPAYNERKYILRPLASLATQRGVNPDQYEVIVVINNPPTAPIRDESETEGVYQKKTESYQAAVADNQETLSLIRHITDEHFPAALMEEEDVIVKNIRQSGLRLFVVDKASEGKTLPQDEANVGGARNRGVAEAIERFHNQINRNGIIAQSDAEVRFPSSYLTDLMSAFRKNPEIVGMVGNVTPEDIDEHQVLFKSLALYKDADDVYQQLVNFAEHGRLYDPGDPAGNFHGSNMASKAFETALVGGVPKVSGAEDTLFGIRLSKIGKTRKIKSLETIPIRRFSARATTGEGQGLLRAASNTNDAGDFLVENPETGMPDIPILEAASKLLATLSKDERLTLRNAKYKKYLLTRQRRLVEGRKKSLSKLLSIIFENKSVDFNITMLINIIVLSKSKTGLSDRQIQRLRDRELALHVVSKIISEAKTKEDALNEIINEFSDELSLPAEDSLQYKLIEMHAMTDAIEDLEQENRITTPKQ